MQAKEKGWFRIFGRLHRRASATIEGIMRPGYQRVSGDSPQYRDPRSLSPGVDVHPGMDRDPAPTDPEVYNSSRQPTTSREEPCNHYARPIDIRRLRPGQILRIPLAISEEVQQSPQSPALHELENILNDLEAPPMEDNIGNEPQSATESQQQEQQQQQQGNDLVYDYVTMQPLAAAAAAAVENRQRPSRPAQPLPTIPEQRGGSDNNSHDAEVPSSSSRHTPEIPVADLPPIRNYDNLPQPQLRCESGMIHAPIPQGSPPLPRQRNLRFPPYYRDYANILAMPSYSLICHSAWYAQSPSSVIMCLNCATAEHLFCSLSRPQAAWRHIHIIARNFYHTTMHCGRCYKLILRTRRAIDCSRCRLYVIEHNREVERIIYKILCDTTVPYPYDN